MDSEKKLNILAQNLEQVIEEIYGRRMGFALLVFDFNTEGASDYVANANRKDMIKALRETADRFENNEIIPVTIGEA